MGNVNLLLLFSIILMLLCVFLIAVGIGCLSKSKQGVFRSLAKMVLSNRILRNKKYTKYIGILSIVIGIIYLGMLIFSLVTQVPLSMLHLLIAAIYTILSLCGWYKYGN